MVPEESMKIPLVYAHHNEGCAPSYTLAALQRLGHETRRMSTDEYFAAEPAEYDLFFCQDSGEGIDFRRASAAHLRKSSMWWWDSAWNYKQRNPGDDEMSLLISQGGGWVFHAWQHDLDRCSTSTRIERHSLLPVAGDPYLWSDEPAEEKRYGLSFVGNCYDPGRGVALNYATENCGLYWPGPNSQFFQDAAKTYRQSWAVFNPPTFWRLPHDFTGERVDLMQGTTMRHWEAMCVGVPLVCTPKSDFAELGYVEGVHYFSWEELEQIPAALERAKKTAQEGGVEYSKALRQLVLGGNTYEHRIIAALETVKRAGMLS